MVRSPVDSVSPARFAFAAWPDGVESKATACEITLPSGVRVRRRSSDTAADGIGRRHPAAGRLEQTRCARLRGIRQTAPYFHNNNAATLDEVVDHYIEFFKFVKANQPPGVVPPVVSTDGINFDRQLRPDEREALPAYLRKLWTFLA